MRICWDNLENVILLSNNTFRDRGKRITFVYVESCHRCGESYLTPIRQPSNFCSVSCSQKGKTHRQETKDLLSRIYKGREFSMETRAKISENRKGKTAGKNNYGWKGGVNKYRIALYETYAPQVGFADEVRPFLDKEGRVLLEVACSKCRKWFLPKIGEVKSRVRSLSGKESGESRFYCSQECKDNCEVYRVNANYVLSRKNDSSKVRCNQSLHTIWSQEVLKRANHLCEICGEPAEHAHHIQPKKLEPGLALDPDNGLAVCKKCHYERGHSDGCSTGRIAKS